MARSIPTTFFRNLVGARNPGMPGMGMPIPTTFFRNLAGGLKLLAFLPVDARQFVASLRQVVLFGGLAGAVWLGFDRLTSPSEVSFAWTGVAQIAWIAVTFVSVLLLLSAAGRNPESAALTLTALAAMLPGYLLMILSLARFSIETALQPWVGTIVALLSAAYLFRIARLVLGSSIPVALISAAAVVGATWLAFNETVAVRPSLWRPKDDAAAASSVALEAEEAMFRQPTLIEAAVRRMAPQTAGRTDLYFVGFAGDGKQSVFGSEVEFARAALERKLDLGDRKIELINAPRVDAATPIATRSGLRFALARVAQSMDVNEDVLLLFLTSHGTPSAKLSVYQRGWALEDLSASALAQGLREAGIKWRVIIISACYSGSFIDPLKDEQTLIVTASRADRKSFGCRDNRDLTYYGEALFRDALPRSSSLLDAVTRAAAVVTAREQTEDFLPSEPQTFVGEKMRAKLAELAFRDTCGGNAAAC